MFGPQHSQLVHIKFNTWTLLSVVKPFCSAYNCYILSVGVVINAYLIRPCVDYLAQFYSEKKKKYIKAKNFDM